MKKLLLYFILGLIIGCKSQGETQNTNVLKITKKIDSLLNVKSYFEAKKEFEKNKDLLSDYDAIRLSASIDNLFNKLEHSNQQIDLLFKNYSDQLSKTIAKDLLTVQLSNSVKLFEYKKADEISDRLISGFKGITPTGELQSTKNNGIIWKALKEYPKQRITFNGNSTINLYLDKANLKNLDVESNHDKFPFIFDTGANLSTVIESQAKAMNMDIIDVKVSVNTITGQRVDSKIGVAKNITIGNMVFENVVFLVFPDKALYIPQINYQIKGILGFPVIEAMKEVHFLKNNTVFVPLKREHKHEQNLAIEYLTPIINLKDKSGEAFYYTFDTGADHTMLYKSYFEKNKEIILEKSTKTDINFAGGGGSITKKGYRFNFEPIINNTLIKIDSVAVFPELINPGDQFSYGNIGQDLISKFDKMIINFESMYIRFE